MTTTQQITIPGFSPDFDYIETRSGEAGVLSVDVAYCKVINDGLTRTFDEIFGPDHVDAFDASCNTCKHFQRRGMTAEEKADRNIFGMPGVCSLKQIDVRGWQRGQYCGFDNRGCYENRRSKNL